MTEASRYRQLNDTLEIYGANPDRWPVQERADLLLFVENDEQASKYFKQAQAFDRLLDDGDQAVPQDQKENQKVQQNLSRLSAAIVAQAGRVAQVSDNIELLELPRQNSSKNHSPINSPAKGIVSDDARLAGKDEASFASVPVSVSVPVSLTNSTANSTLAASGATGLKVLLPTKLRRWEYAALAVSLVIGVFVGISDLPNLMLSGEFEVAAAGTDLPLFAEGPEWQGLFAEVEF